MIRVGIFFGGPSREREISFAGGRTVFDNLNKQLFEPVLYFIDSRRHLIELDWSYMYKGTIRDLYPPAAELPPSPHHFQIYLESLGKMSEETMQRIAGSVGVLRQWTDLPGRIDLAFLALHGEFGEDGQIQGLLESLDIPYTGSGIRASAIGIDKGIQKKLMHAGGFSGPEHRVIHRQDWLSGDIAAFFSDARSTFGQKVVIRPANQGSSIGVSIIDLEDIDVFQQAVDQAFFRWRLSGSTWRSMAPDARVQWVRQISDIRSGSGFPLLLNDKIIHHPEELLTSLTSEPRKPGCWKASRPSTPSSWRDSSRARNSPASSSERKMAPRLPCPRRRSSRAGRSSTTGPNTFPACPERKRRSICPMSRSRRSVGNASDCSTTSTSRSTPGSTGSSWRMERSSSMTRIRLRG